MGTHFTGAPREVRALNTYIKLMRCASSVHSRLERRLLRVGLTDNQFGILEALLHLGPLAQHELGRALFTSRANVTTIVDNLERRGLVARVRNTDDRRYITVQLTPEGRSLIEASFPGHVAEIVDEFSALSPDEQQQLAALCKKLGLAASQERVARSSIDAPASNDIPHGGASQSRDASARAGPAHNAGRGAARAARADWHQEGL